MRWILVALFALLVACSSQTPSSQGFTLEQIGQLTPEQIENLSEEQLKQVNQVLQAEFARAEEELAKVQKDLEAQELEAQASRWPNFSYTVYVATGISYTTYLNSYYRSYSGPNWSTDGCSAPKMVGGDSPGGFNFRSPCIQHDFGYRNVAQYLRGRIPGFRDAIDYRFLLNMNSVCSPYVWYKEAKCRAYAAVYYGAVRTLGLVSYLKTPLNYP